MWSTKYLKRMTWNPRIPGSASGRNQELHPCRGTIPAQDTLRLGREHGQDQRSLGTPTSGNPNRFTYIFTCGYTGSPLPEDSAAVQAVRDALEEARPQTLSLLLLTSKYSPKNPTTGGEAMQTGPYSILGRVTVERRQTGDPTGRCPQSNAPPPSHASVSGRNLGCCCILSHPHRKVLLFLDPPRIPEAVGS